jgi:hemin uptake protein HemP
MRIIIIRVLMDDDKPEDARRIPARERVHDSAAPRRVDSRALFAGGRELVIVHDGRNYHLRITQNGKLILTA